MNITDALTEHARNRPDHPAIEDGDRIITYRELDRLVDAAAANLRATGVGVGDRVGVLLEESADHALAFCGLARAGAIIFSLSPSAAPEELRRNLAAMATKAVISSGAQSPDGELISLDVQDVCAVGAQRFDESRVGGDAPLVLIQSSGTTGLPKSFLRSHDELAIWAQRHSRNQGWTAEDRSLSLVHLSFNMGLNNLFGMLLNGATVVIDRTRGHDALVTLVRDKRVTYLYLTPSHLVPLIAYAADKAPLFPNLRMLVVATAPTTAAQRLLARQLLCANLCEALGTNEAGLLTFATPADQDAYPEAVGRLADNVEAQIVDEEGRLLPPGEVGHVRFRSIGYPAYYLDDPQANARAFRDGWFYPGDLATLNDDGYLFLKGRADDVVNNGGAKFYPVEVETVLLSHPQVREAAVLAWPHARLGQVGAACVVADPGVTAKALQAFCRQRIAGYKVPAIIAFADALPKNAMGKVVKRELHDVIVRAAAQRRVSARVSAPSAVSSSPLDSDPTKRS